jgi:hypothetical protein
VPGVLLLVQSKAIDPAVGATRRRRPAGTPKGSTTPTRGRVEYRQSHIARPLPLYPFEPLLRLASCCLASSLLLRFTVDIRFLPIVLLIEESGTLALQRGP